MKIFPDKYDERFQRSISLGNVQKIADALEIETYLLFMEETND